jgi:hypothetical protein
MLALCAIGVVACVDDNTTVTSAVFTGVLVRSEALVDDHGCGTNSGQIYKYAVVVSYSSDAITAGKAGGGFPTTNILGGLYDCFSDANFQSICPSNAPYGYLGPSTTLGANGQPLPAYGCTNGDLGFNATSTEYELVLSVFAYDAPTFNANADRIVAAVNATALALDTNGNPVPLTVTGNPDLDGLRVLPSTYTTTCSATEQGGIQVVATCADLVSSSTP